MLLSTFTHIVEAKFHCLPVPEHKGLRISKKESLLAKKHPQNPRCENPTPILEQ